MDQWGNPSEHQIGVGFICAVLKDQIVFWGGSQRQPDGNYLTFLNNCMYTFKLPQPYALNGEWKIVPVSGDLHPGPHSAAAVVCDQTLFILGGKDGHISNATSCLSTLSCDGQFVRKAMGCSIPRLCHQGWSFGSSIFFFAGLSREVDDARKQALIPWGEDPNNIFVNNDLVQIDPSTGMSRLLSTTGSIPSPRTYFALAQIGENIYIHGGYCNRRLGDFYTLNLHTFQWTQIADTGFPGEICDHTLSKVSPREILLTGGGLTSGISNQVKLFDVEVGKWRDEAALPVEVSGPNGGLRCHEAISVPREDGVFVICVGGYCNLKMTEHPTHMALLEIRCESSFENLRIPPPTKFQS